MKTFIIMGRKGGITKTTIAINLGAALARAGLRTVVIDEGQGNASAIMGIQPHDGLYSLLIDDHEFADVLKPVTKDFHGSDGELFVLSSYNLHRKLEENPDTPAYIYERFAELNDWADAVVVDTAPSITHVHAGFYYVSDYAILPTLPDFPSILSLQSTLGFLASAKQEGEQSGYSSARVLGILPNVFNMGEGIDRENYGWLRGKYDGVYPVFPFLRKKTVWKQAIQFRRSIYNLPAKADYNARVQARAAIMEFQPVVTAALAITGVEVAS